MASFACLFCVLLSAVRLSLQRKSPNCNATTMVSTGSNLCCGVLPSRSDCPTAEAPRRLEVTEPPRVHPGNLLTMKVSWEAAGHATAYEVAIECPSKGLFYKRDCFHIPAKQQQRKINLTFQSRECEQREANDGSLCLMSATLSRSIREYELYCRVVVKSLPWERGVSRPAKAYFELISCRALGCPNWRMSLHPCLVAYRKELGSTDHRVCTCRKPDRPRLVSTLQKSDGSIALKWTMSRTQVSPVKATRFEVAYQMLRSGVKHTISVPLDPKMPFYHTSISSYLTYGKRHSFEIKAIAENGRKSRAARVRFRLKHPNYTPSVFLPKRKRKNKHLNELPQPAL